MCVNLPQGLYLGATQKKRERVTHGETRKKPSGIRWAWEQGPVYADQRERPCPFQSPAFPVSHSLILTLYKGVALCRSAPGKMNSIGECGQLIFTKGSVGKIFGQIDGQTEQMFHNLSDNPYIATGSLSGTVFFVVGGCQLAAWPPIFGT